MPGEADKHVPTCNTLWIGGNLGPIGAACLASFVRRGHRVVLHAYDPPADVPAGVEIADAALTIPAARIFRHKASGSYSLFSNLFRYELLRLGRGLWIDCDVYCVRRVTATSAHIYGWQRPGSINGAVLGLPSDAPVLERLISLFDKQSPVLPWLTAAQARELQARRLAGEVFSLADLPWGVAGPEALTYLLTQAGLARHAAPLEVFYPLPWNQGPLLFRAAVDMRRLVRPRTMTMHLWNETASQHLDKVERGSAIDRLRTQGTLFDESFLAAPG
jgi:hypothetical protein